MPRVPKWEALVQRRDIIDGRIFLSSLPLHERESRNELKCAMCMVYAYEHKMIREMLHCSWSACTDCKWQGKVLICLYSNVSYVFERYAHNTSEPVPYPITPWSTSQGDLRALRERFQDEVEREFGQRYKIESTTPTSRYPPTQVDEPTPREAFESISETVSACSLAPSSPRAAHINWQHKAAYQFQHYTPPVDTRYLGQITGPNVAETPRLDTHVYAVHPPELRQEECDSIDRVRKRARAQVEGYCAITDQREPSSGVTSTHSSATNQAKATTKSADGEAVVKQSVFKGDEDDNDPFTFTWLVDINGEPIIGKGWGQRPFLVGVSTKALLRRLDLDASTFVLHVDPSLRSKYNYNAVVSVGISDFAGQFHLVAVFVVLDTSEAIYTMIFEVLCRMYSKVTKKRLRVGQVVGTFDNDLFKAVENVFADECNYLMCFHHVLADVLDDRFHPFVAKESLQGFINMHFATGDEDFDRIVEETTFNEWWFTGDAPEFYEYFEKTCLHEDFAFWQCYHTAPGLTSTCEPADEFRKTMRRAIQGRDQLGLLLEGLLECCRVQSTFGLKFAETVRATPALRRRYKKLAKDGLLISNPAAPTSSRVIFVYAKEGPPVTITLSKRTPELLTMNEEMRQGYARMEVEGQPPWGWAVNLVTKTCPCRYFFKHGVCVHLLFAFEKCGFYDELGEDILANLWAKKSDSGAVGVDIPPPPPDVLASFAQEQTTSCRR